MKSPCLNIDLNKFFLFKWRYVLIYTYDKYLKFFNVNSFKDKNLPQFLVITVKYQLVYTRFFLFLPK